MKHFSIALLVAAACLTGCAGNPAPVYETGANRTLLLPASLALPGSQAKIRFPGENSMVLVWRTSIGFGGTELRCGHCHRDIVFVADKQILMCPSGISYSLDGSLIRQSVPEGEMAWPLRAYIVELDGDRLKILG